MATKRAKVGPYPSNSHSKKEEIIEPVVRTRRVSSQPTGFAQDIRRIATHLYYEVMIPAAKATVSEALSRGLEAALWGENQETFGRSGKGRRTNYSGMYGREQGRPSSKRRGEVREVSDILELDDIIFDSPDQARYVLERMKSRIEDYRWCTVAEFLALSGQTNSWNHERYGWFSLKNVTIRRTSEGYYIDFPEPSFAD